MLSHLGNLPPPSDPSLNAAVTLKALYLSAGDNSVMEPGTDSILFT